MTDKQPALRPGFDAQIWWFSLGLLIFGIFCMALFFGGSFATGSAAITIALAIIMIIVTGGAALLAFRSRKIGLGSGLLIGYALAAVASGGECTFLNSSMGYGALAGFFIYLYSLVFAVIVGMIASIISAVMRRRRKPE